MTYVKNASGTSRWSKPSTGESSWLEYWEKKTGIKRLPVVALPIAIPQAPLLALTFRRCLEATSSISHLFAPDAISEATTSGLTPNWSEYPADCKQLLGMQRLKCSVAESDGHRIVTHNLNPYYYEERNTRCF